MQALQQQYLSIGLTLAFLNESMEAVVTDGVSVYVG